MNKGLKQIRQLMLRTSPSQDMANGTKQTCRTISISTNTIGQLGLEILNKTIQRMILAASCKWAVLKTLMAYITMAMVRPKLALILETMELTRKSIFRGLKMLSNSFPQVTIRLKIDQGRQTIIRFRLRIRMKIT